MIKGFSHLMRLLFRLLDFFILNIVLFLAKLAFHHLPDGNGHIPFIKYWAFLVVAWYTVSWAGGVYNATTIESFEIFSRATVRSYLLWVCAALFCLFFFGTFALPHGLIFATLAGFGGALLLNRILYIPLANLVRRRSILHRNVLVVGYNTTAKMLVENLESEHYHIIGYCENADLVHEPSLYPITGSRQSVMAVAKKYAANEIFCTLPMETFPEIYELMHEADQACIRFRLVPPLHAFVKRPMHLSYLKNIPVLSPREEPLEDYTNWYRKRIFDVLISAVVIVFLLSWLIPLMALLIKIESRGAVFFVQMRSGKNNVPFPCIKFRSMYPNKESDEKQASKNDFRVTRVGKFIRATSIDELPQFFNVFLGEMSVVGPRPHMLKHTEDYSLLINKYMVRQFLRPGVTGWAQVNGLRGETRSTEDMAARIEHDIWYMENWGMWLDARIIILTASGFFKKQKNAF